MKYGCIGEHLPHSFSKDIHERIGAYEYMIKELSPEELGAFMDKKDFSAINVTIPYKQAVIPYLDEISETARTIGAVNTIVNRDGRLSGYNTDFSGMKALIKKLGIELSGKKVLILGSGGTSKTARAVCESLSSGEIYRVSRSKKENSLSYEEARLLHSDADVIINTTPCGMFPDIENEPLDIDLFPNLSGVIDAIYNPLASRMVQKALRRDIKAEGGLYMLVAQAVLAAEIFTGKKYGDMLIEKIYSEILSEKQNIVLIGMPGSGKTTVGKLLSKKTGRKMIDTDQIISEKSGMPIQKIFSEFGEGYFRELEAKTVAEAAKQSGCIIATGGGCVLREENVQALKQNGRLYFLNRKLSQLSATQDRPLSDSSDKLQKLYAERCPIYVQAADEIIKAEGRAKETANIIESRHLK